MKRLMVLGLLLASIFSLSLGDDIAGDIGFVSMGLSCSAPYNLIGLGFSSMKKTGEGYFCRMKMGIPVPEDAVYEFSESLSQDWNDEHLGTRKTYFTLLGGIQRRFGFTEFIGYFGGGISFVNKYYEYHDDSEILSPDGDYYVLDDRQIIKVRLSAGMVFPFYTEKKRLLLFNFGFDFNPYEMSFGLEWPLVF